MTEQEFREHLAALVDETCGSAGALARKHKIHPKVLGLFLSGARGASPDLAAAFGFRRDYIPLDTPKAQPLATTGDEALREALEGVMPILARAESNASGNPEWDFVGPRVKAVRDVLAKTGS